MEVFGGGLGLDVHTEGEFEDALQTATVANDLVFVEIYTGRLAPRRFAVPVDPWQ